MKKLVKESLTEQHSRSLYPGERPGEPLTMPAGYEEAYGRQTFTVDDVRKILRSIIGYTKEPGRLCGNLDSKIKTLAKKHGIKL